MSWGKFLLLVMLAYLGWYALNIVIDILKGGRKVVANNDTSYSLKDLVEDEAVDVNEIPVEEEIVDYKKKG